MCSSEKTSRPQYNGSKGSGTVPNQSLQQTKPPVTVRAYARPAPAVFAAEARCYAVGPITAAGTGTRGLDQDGG